VKSRIDRAPSFVRLTDCTAQSARTGRMDGWTDGLTDGSRCRNDPHPKHREGGGQNLIYQNQKQKQDPAL
jgi:hypothetical protein